MESRWAESHYTGLFTQFGPVPPRPHDPAVSTWGGRLAASGPRAQASLVGGAGWDPRGARDACLGEAIERWQSHRLPADRVVAARFAGWRLDEPAVAPSRWVLFAAEQYARPGFPFRPASPDSEYQWVCCRRAPDGGPWWVPADLVYLDARPGGSHDFGPSTSTGLACGRFGQPVLLRGVQEVIERDALMGAWWGRYPLVESDPGKVLGMPGLSISGRLLRPNLRYRTYRVDSPYSAHATIVTLEGQDREGYCFSAGSACRETRAASWRKSLLEAVQGRHYVRRLTAWRREPGADRPGGTSGDRDASAAGSSPPVTFAEHAAYYSLHPEALPETVLHRTAAPAADRDDDAGRVEDLARLIERLGPERPVLFRNLTPPAVAEGPSDWYVLRALVPGLQPMHGDHRFPFLGGPLWRPRGLADWSRIPPHPFP